MIFQWEFPCDASDTRYFHQRSSSGGFEKIFTVWIIIDGGQVKEPEVCIDTTVQEKCTTFPTVATLYRKVHAGV